MAHRRKLKDMRREERAALSEIEKDFYESNAPVLQDLHDVILEEQFYAYCAQNGRTPGQVMKDLRNGVISLESLEVVPDLTLNFWMADVDLGKRGGRPAGTPDAVQCPADGSPSPEGKQVDDE